MTRKQTLFYTDSVNILRSIYKTKDYKYRDDFYGEIIILRDYDHLITVEIKSEKEVASVSTQSGTTFRDLRDKINSLSCFGNRGDGKHKGWLAILAQCWDYMQNGLPDDIQRDSYSSKEDLLVLPYDKKDELKAALCELNRHFPSIEAPEPTIHDYPSDNISILIYRHNDLDSFFEKIQSIDSEPSHALESRADALLSSDAER